MLKFYNFSFFVLIILFVNVVHNIRYNLMVCDFTNEPVKIIKNVWKNLDMPEKNMENLQSVF